VRFKYEECECGKTHIFYVNSSTGRPPRFMDYTCPTKGKSWILDIGIGNIFAAEPADQPTPGDVIATALP